jgi:L-2-hydroxyglutarate oxidase
VTTSCAVTDVDGSTVTHAAGHTQAQRGVIFCAGAWADRLAVRSGAAADPRIVPFKGAYLRLTPEKRQLVNGLIYPVPDPRLPFLGVHLTKHVDGTVLVGPTAMLVPHARSLAWPGTWRMMRRFWRTGIEELRYAASKKALVKAARAYVPELQPEDVTDGFSGTRAQALARDGGLVDVVVFSETGRALHVRNAPSPAATSSLAIARLIATRAEAAFDL